MPSLEQIAAQYSLSRFPQHPYARAKYEQGFKDGVNFVLENEDVNDLVIDAYRNEISRLIIQISLPMIGETIELRNPLRTKSNYEEKRPEKISVTRSLEDKEVEVTSTGSILEIIWKRNGKVIYDPQFPADKIIEIKEYLEGLRFLLLTKNLKTQVADFLAPYLQFLE